MTKPNDDLNQRVAERIQAELVMLLPEEEIRTRVDAIIDSFFATGKVTETYSSKSYKESPFEALVKQHLTSKANEIIKTIFNSEAWKVKIEDDLTISIGIALQKALNIDPDILKDVTAAAVARNRATHLAGILGGLLAQNFNNYEIGNAYISAVNSEYNRVFNR